MSFSSVPLAEESGTRFGRRPAARSRSTVRLRAIVWSHAASEPVSRVEQLRSVPEREKRLLHHFFGDLPIGCQPDRRREDRVDVPVVQGGQRVLRTGGNLANEGRFVAWGVTVACHRLRAAGLVGFDRERKGPSLEAAREDDVGLGREHMAGRLDAAARIRSRSRVSRARTLMR